MEERANVGTPYEIGPEIHPVVQEEMSEQDIQTGTPEKYWNICDRQTDGWNDRRT